MTTVKQGEVLQVALLAPPFVLRDYHFIDCVLRGPAVLHVAKNNTVTRCTIDIGDDPDLFWWNVTPGAPKIGLLAFEDSIFEGCTFQACGFAGPLEDRKLWLDSFVNRP